MYSLPQEIEVWYIIPAIRKEFSKTLVQDRKMTYESVGAILGISKAAVSQYLTDKRANKMKLPPSIVKEIKKSARIVQKSPKRSVAEIERILKIIRDKKIVCEACKKYNPEVLKFCEKHVHY